MTYIGIDNGVSGTIGIIYKATNIINGKIYIGQTIHTLERRIKTHVYSSFKNTNKYTVFNKAIRKHGAENFKWEIIAECSSKEELNSAEIGAIFINKSFGENNVYDRVFGYNMTTGGNSGGCFIGRKNSDETKALMSRAQIGKKHTESTKKLLSVIFTNRPSMWWGRKHKDSSKKKNVIYT